METPKIRPIALALLRNKDQILVFKASDEAKQEDFFRLLGGGIEFSETAATAVKREIKEEIDADIKVTGLLSVYENIFNYNGTDMHEIVFVCEAKFTDPGFYNKNNIKIKDGKRGRYAIWVGKDELKKSRFYPSGMEKLI